MPPTTVSNQGIVLIAILTNAYLFGQVSQQFYAYWTIGFKDSLRLRLFVIVQFVLVAFQCLIMWRLALEIFVVFPTQTIGTSPPSPKLPWEAPTNSICQLFIILMANIFLACRIYVLTKSTLLCCSVITLSVLAFALGMATNVIASMTPSFTTPRQDLSIAWHSMQATVECLITFLLSRVLLKSRSGMRRSDLAVNHIVRFTIQTGFVATAWALAALATWFLLPNISVYRIFDMTSGTIRTHAMFETLLSRIQLRELLKPSSYIHISLQGGQTGPSEPPGQPRGSASIPGVSGPSSTPLNASGLGHGSTPASQEVIELQTLE